MIVVLGYMIWFTCLVSGLVFCVLFVVFLFIACMLVGLFVCLIGFPDLDLIFDLVGLGLIILLLIGLFIGVGLFVLL